MATSGEILSLIGAVNASFEQSLQTFVAEAKTCLQLDMILDFELKYSCLDEKKSQIRLQNGVSNPKPDDPIKLNVSGWKVQYLRRFFLSATGSLLAAMFSGRWDEVLPKDSKGRFFINENPVLFDYILKKLANIPISRQFEDSELKILDSIYERYKIPKSWSEGKGDVQPTPQKARISLLSNHTASLKKPLLNVLDCIEDVRAASKMLAEQYERDSLLLEDEINFIGKLIKDSSVVLELNVRGEFIVTSKSTLQVYPDSMLATKFDESKWTLQRDKDLDEDGYIFLDVDPSIFRGILDHLRWKQFHPGEMCPEISNCQQKEIIERTLVYLFPGIGDEYSMFSETCTNFCFDDTHLLNGDNQQLVLFWCNESLPLHNFSKGKLIYRASRDGWSSLHFHSKCEGETFTVLVISANGAVFGGFSDIPWKKSSSEAAYEHSSHAFLFSVVPPRSVTASRIPAKFVLKDPKKYAICQKKEHLAAFGCGDLFISKNANAYNRSSSKLGRSYISSEAAVVDNYLVGSTYFSIDEIECFAIV